MKKLILYLTLLMALFFLIYHPIAANEQPGNGDFRPGQTDILPPSPTAGTLGQYGLVPVSLATGAINISVPLHQIDYHGISMPLSLSYSSGGIKVNEVASWVGLGWSLNAGGVITRVVRDEMDDQMGGRHFPENFSDWTDPRIAEFLDSAQYEGIDTEPDLFMFNFMGYTGKFVISQGGVPRIMPAKNLRITQIEDNTDAATNVYDFIIDTPDGVSYFFDKHEVTNTVISCSKNFPGTVTAWYLTKIVHPSGAEVTIEYNSSTTEYLSSIDQTFRKYTDGIVGRSQCQDDLTGQPCLRKLRTLGAKLKTISFGNQKIEFESLEREDVIHGDRLEVMSLLVDGTVIKKWKFQYEYSNSDKNPSEFSASHTKKRLFLMGVSELDPTESISKDHSFQYIEKDKLPARLSFSQDHWGFYNGQNNEDLVPEVPDVNFALIGGNREPNSAVAQFGLLEKITYPTGGHTKLEYESHTVDRSSSSQKKHEDILKNYEWSVTSETEVGLVSKTEQVTFKYPFKAADIVCSASVDASHDGYEFTGHSVGQMIIKTESGADVVNRTFYLSDPNSVKYISYYSDPNLHGYLYFGAGTYTITVRTREFSTATVQILGVKIGERDYIESGDLNATIGGVRISKVTSHDGFGLPKTKKYYYASSGRLTVSSGIKPRIPSYQKWYNREYMDGPQLFECNYVDLYSSSQLNLFSFDGGHMFYKNVIEAEGEGFSNGYTEHEFYEDLDVAPKVILGDDIPSAPYSNTGWKHGLEKRVTKKDASGKIVYQKTNDWEAHENVKAVSSLVVQVKNSDLIQWPVTIKCTAEVQNITWTQRWCAANHKHYWVSKLFGDYQVCRAFGSDNKEEEKHHSCYYMPTDTVRVMPWALDHLNAVLYKNYSYWYYLKGTNERYYDKEGRAVATRTNYDYESEEHLQLTRKSVNTSKGKTVTSTYKYANDYPEGNGSIVDSMISRHIVGIPLETIVDIDGSVVSAQATHFSLQSGQILPNHFYQYQTTVPDLNFTESTDGMSFPKYDTVQSILEHDNYGNVLSAQMKNNSIVSYVWGYDQKYPIAKIENADYTEVKTALGGTTGLENLQNKSGEELLSAINILRSTIGLEDALITSYSYKEGFGVEAIVSPNGAMTSFTYDGLGRLKYVKDQDGNVIKSNSYHFKNQSSN